MHNIHFDGQYNCTLIEALGGNSLPKYEQEKIDSIISKELVKNYGIESDGENLNGPEDLWHRIDLAELSNRLIPGVLA